MQSLFFSLLESSYAAVEARGSPVPLHALPLELAASLSWLRHSDEAEELGQRCASEELVCPSLLLTPQTQFPTSDS